MRPSQPYERESFQLFPPAEVIEALSRELARDGRHACVACAHRGHPRAACPAWTG